jgi:hypothetical protein
MDLPEQLNIQCTLGAIYLPKLGSIRGLATRYRSDIDEKSTFNLQVKNDFDSNYSRNLMAIGKGFGGTLPRINGRIGAPYATFAEGSVIPGSVCYPYTGIVAATDSKFSTKKYALPLNITTVDYNTYEGIDNPNSSVSVDSFLQNASYGYIPLRTNEISGDTSTKTTWNIWKQYTKDDLKKKFIAGLGVTNYEELGAPHISTTIGAEIPGISVNATNSVCLLERQFPIADDLVYNDPNIHFRNIEKNSLTTKTVKAKGGPNCGFRLHFQNLSKFESYVSNGKFYKSSLGIAFGDLDSPGSSKTINQFAIIVNDSSIDLNYYHPVKGWNKFSLNKNGFKGGSDLELYIHFAGPSMYVGLDSNPSNWEVFDPQPTDSGDNEKILPFISEKSIIRVQLENINCTFNYGPICFDTHDTSNIDSSTYGQSTVKMQFDVNNDDMDALSSIEQDRLNNDFYNRQYAYGTANSNNRKFTEMPTFFADCRSMNVGKGSEIKTIEQYSSSPEFKFINGSYSIDSSNENIRKILNTQLVYDTTIEGPILHYARNFIDPGATQTTIDSTTVSSSSFNPKSSNFTYEKLVKPIWGKYSDITKYFESARIDEKFVNDNLSYKVAVASITLRNMTNDNIGRQILNAIQENILVITLKAGYDSNGMHTYFQGVINKVVVKRTSDSFTVTLDCQDLGDYLLEKIKFNFASNVPLSFRPYGFIIRDVFDLSGLLPYLKPRDRKIGFDPLYDRYFNYMEGSSQFGISLNNRITEINMTKNPKQVISNLFMKMYIPKNTTSGIIGSENFPVFRWDPSFEVFTMGLRNDDAAEELWFAGETLPLNSNNLQPVAKKNGSIHGIVVGGQDGWTETTNVSELHSEVWVQAQLYDQSPFAPRSQGSFVKQAVSAEAFARLQALVTDGINEYQERLGYVGFNKLNFEDLSSNPLMKTKNQVNNRLRTKEYLARNTRQELEFQVYVTKPLQSHLRFKIKSFEDSGFLDFSDEYIYTGIVYNINADTNLITAYVTGNNLPEG